MPVKRGIFVVFEGLDRSGKSTQVKELANLLKPSVCIAYPNRTTESGKIIDNYLKGHVEKDDKVIHKLFSENRWEDNATIKNHLLAGTSVICDRYAFSGVAFTMGKDIEGVDIDWCKSFDVGLVKPDAVLYLKCDDSENRGGYGTERYENKVHQEKTAKIFELLKEDDYWSDVNANGSIEQVRDRIWTIVKEVKERREAQGIANLWV